MTDKELLELAAKAAGIDYCERDFWFPLSDDGDALRLAIKLKLQIQPWDDRVDSGKFPFGGQCEMYGKDPYAATRRAIVRAAAEIGRSHD